jgi:hypothetical protein
LKEQEKEEEEEEEERSKIRKSSFFPPFSNPFKRRQPRNFVVWALL